jgi:hypothetical protein
MDAQLLADTLTTFLAPAMPFLVKGGEDLVKQAGKKLGEGGLDLAKKLWQKLRPKAEASSMAKGAAEEVAAAPDNPDARATLRLQLQKILEADPSLAAELERMMEGVGVKTTYQAANYGSGAIAQGPGAVAAGQGGAAVGGSVQGDLHVGGGGKAWHKPASDE